MRDEDFQRGIENRSGRDREREGDSRPTTTNLRWCCKYTVCIIRFLENNYVRSCYIRSYTVNIRVLVLIFEEDPTGSMKNHTDVT